MHCFAYGFDCHMHNSLNCWIIVLIWKTKLPFLVGMIDKSIHGRGFYWLQFLSCFWPHFTTTWGEGDGAFGFSFVSSSILEVLSCNPTICANTYKFLPRDKPAYSRIQNGRLPRSCWEHWCNSRHAETCVACIVCHKHTFGFKMSHGMYTTILHLLNHCRQILVTASGHPAR